MEVYLNISNFGKIKKARVNISNFTIFVGNNNSGKTQLMELIYAVIKRISVLTPNINVPQIEDMEAFHIGEKEIVYLHKFINAYLEKNLQDIIDDTFHTSIPIEELTLDFENIDRSYDFYFLKESTAAFLLEKKIITQEQLMEILQNKNQYYETIIIKNDEGSMETQGSKISKRFANDIPDQIAKSIAFGDILGDIVAGNIFPFSMPLFLPASRMGLMLLYKHYFESSSRTKENVLLDNNREFKGITKPVSDFLSFLLRYNYTEHSAKKNEQLIRFIFQNLIDGTIDETGDITMYTPVNEEKQIPIFAASSMVNEVVPVVKALTDSDTAGFLFYDEVETSMHPLKQMEMAKLLNRLNNHGIRLIVSTHSDTMATKMNNLLLFSYADMDFETKKHLMEKSGISIEKEDLLVSKRIHVYQFINDAQGKSSVEELEFHRVPYTGYDFTLFNDSTMALFEEAKIVMGIDNED